MYVVQLLFSNNDDTILYKNIGAKDFFLKNSTENGKKRMDVFANASIRVYIV